MVGRACERLQPVEAGSGAGDGWRPTRCDVREDADEPAQVLREVRHPTLGLVDVFAATLPTLAFTPGVHVNYSETVLPMRDGLPKLKDFPAELGGSGEMVTE